MGRTELTLDLHAQPNDFTCGPTCLHGVYSYWGEKLTLEDTIASTPMLPGDGAGRGTLAVLLGVDALRRGYKAHLVTFNLTIFDPTWFGPAGTTPLPAAELQRKLIEQAREKEHLHPRLPLATTAYLEFLELGGRISMPDLTSSLISGHLRRGVPVLTGLSSTYLYRAEREFGPNDDEDDVRGEPAGHFVVLCGYDAARRTVTVADPLEDKPAFETRKYRVPMARLVGAIMLGVLTYDANLLAIEPAAGSDRGPLTKDRGVRHPPAASQDKPE